MAKQRKRGNEDADQAELDIIFPYEDVELCSGQHVTVRQWNIDMGVVLSARVVKLIQNLSGIVGEVELDQMIAVAKDECFDLVATTIGWTVPELKGRANFEDFLALLQAVIDTSLVTKTGGVLPKVVSLAGSLVPLIGVGAKKAEADPSPAPSTSSSEPATASPT